MQSFRRLDEMLDPVPGSVVATLASIERAAGREDRYRTRMPALLNKLAFRARVESVRASSAIEDIIVDPGRLQRLLRGSVEPRTRSEAEVAGYRDSLDFLFGPGATETFDVGLLLRLHRQLFAYTDSLGGRLKSDDNRVVDLLPSGLRVDRFETVPARDTEYYVRELHHALDLALADGTHHPIFVIGAYVLDLLVIHPFDNGNGRTARLATTALLQRSGYEVVRYVAVEGLVDRTSDEYYRTLAASTAGWHDGTHDLWPWLKYLIERIAEGYVQFDALADDSVPQGTKASRVEAFVLNAAAPVFSKDDIRAALPDIGDSSITRVLHRLRDQRQIELLDAGANAKWQRLSS